MMSTNVIQRTQTAFPTKWFTTVPCCTAIDFVEMPDDKSFEKSGDFTIKIIRNATVEDEMKNDFPKSTIVVLENDDEMERLSSGMEEQGYRRLGQL